MAARNSRKGKAETGLTQQDAQQLMDDSADREHKDTVKALGNKKQQATVIAQAAEDVTLYLASEKARYAADTSRLKLAIGAGRRYANPNIAANTDEQKGPLGLTPLGLFYLDHWSTTLQARRNETKKTPMTRSDTSAFAAIMAAVQVGAGVTLKWEEKGEDGKMIAKSETVPQDVGDWLSKQSGRWQDIVSLAREVRSAAGEKYQSSRGNKAKTRAISIKTVAAQLANYHGRMGHDTLMLMLDFVNKEARAAMLPGNYGYFDPKAQAFKLDVSKCLLERVVPDVPQGTVTQLPAPAVEVPKTGTNG